MRVILLLLALVAAAGCDRQKAGEQQGAAPAEATLGEPSKGLDRSQRGKPFPSVEFLQDDSHGGGETTFEPFLGVPTLVNLWATWCAPCVKELPTLHKLAWSKSKVHVLPISQDSGPQSSIRAFMARHGVEELGNYQDPQMKLLGALEVQVLPTSILYDSNGREIWRYVGDLDWTGPEAARLLDEAH